MQIGSVHYIVSTGLDEIQNVYVVHFSIGNLDKIRDRASEIEKRMDLHRPLVLAETCPREE